MKKDQTLTVIRPDGTTQTVVVKAFEATHQMRTLVGGMMVCLNLPKRKVLVVNEQGLLLGLPPNHAASEAAGQFIVGTAVLCDKSAFNK